MNFLKRHAGKIVLGAAGVAAGVCTGGIGIAAMGTAIGIPSAGTATIMGGTGVLAGSGADSLISRLRSRAQKRSYRRGWEF